MRLVLLLASRPHVAVSLPHLVLRQPNRGLRDDESNRELGTPLCSAHDAQRSIGVFVLDCWMHVPAVPWENLRKRVRKTRQINADTVGVALLCIDCALGGDDDSVAAEQMERREGT